MPNGKEIIKNTGYWVRICDMPRAQQALIGSSKHLALMCGDLKTLEKELGLLLMRFRRVVEENPAATQTLCNFLKAVQLSKQEFGGPLDVLEALNLLQRAVEYCADQIREESVERAIAAYDALENGGAE